MIRILKITANIIRKIGSITLIGCAFSKRAIINIGPKVKTFAIMAQLPTITNEHWYKNTLHKRYCSHGKSVISIFLRVDQINVARNRLQRRCPYSKRISRMTTPQFLPPGQPERLADGGQFSEKLTDHREEQSSS
jgi:hypothetical protein